jgi:hypothetical protein
MHLAPLPEISQEVSVIYLPARNVGMQAADATWMVLISALGLQDPQGPHGLPRWLYEGATPTPDELFHEATTAERRAGARRASSYWAAVYQRAERTAVRHRRMAARMRDVERRSTGVG